MLCLGQLVENLSKTSYNEQQNLNEDGTFYELGMEIVSLSVVGEFLPYDRSRVWNTKT